MVLRCQTAFCSVGPTVASRYAVRMPFTTSPRLSALALRHTFAGLKTDDLLLDPASFPFYLSSNQEDTFKSLLLDTVPVSVREFPPLNWHLDEVQAGVPMVPMNKVEMLSWMETLPSTNNSLVDRLIAAGLVQAGQLEAALRRIDRRIFVESHWPQKFAFLDTRLLLGEGVVELAPSVVAAHLQLLAKHCTQGVARVLDVGPGSGYRSAVLSVLVGGGGRVVSLQPGRQAAGRALHNANKALAAVPVGERGQLHVVEGDVLGAPCAAKLGRYDAIYVAQPVQQLPQVLVQALKPGGRLVVTLKEAGSGEGELQLVVVDKLRDGSLCVKNPGDKQKEGRLRMEGAVALWC